MKAALNSFKKKLAQLGRSMLVPVTAMPVAGILSRIASPDMLNIPLLKSAGDIVFGNMDILFALGAVVAFAKAKDKVSPMVASLLSILPSSALSVSSSSVSSTVCSSRSVCIMSSTLTSTLTSALTPRQTARSLPVR